MGAVETSIKAEIVRLAKREGRKLVAPLREELKRLKKRDADRKAQIAALESRLQQAQAKERLAATAAKATAGEVKGRLSPRLILSLRKKLGLSQGGFARLLDVSTLSIGNWELGKTNPRPEMRTKILSFRGMGKREARAIVENLLKAAPVNKSRAAKTKSVAPKRQSKKVRPGKKGQRRG